MTLFDPASLHTQVLEALAAANIPEGDTHAFAFAAASDGTVKAVISTRVGDSPWQIDLVGTIAKGHQPEGGVQVKASWK
jgi:hypothetical protein